jgi:hypothetical protein
MGEDAHWEDVLAFVKWSEAHPEKPEKEDAAEFIRRFDTYCKTLEAIAADPHVDAEERAAANELLEVIAVQCRAATPAALRTLARIAGNAEAPADLRAEADNTLARATERMPAASRARH